MRFSRTFAYLGHVLGGGLLGLFWFGNVGAAVGALLGAGLAGFADFTISHSKS